MMGAAFRALDNRGGFPEGGWGGQGRLGNACQRCAAGLPGRESEFFGCLLLEVNPLVSTSALATDLFLPAGRRYPL